jgi:hypothetical protein
MRAGLNEASVVAKTASVGTSPVAARATAPIKGRIRTIFAVLEGTITTAPAAIAVSINGGSDITGGNFSIPIGVAGSGASFEVGPMGNPGGNVSEGDFIAFTPSGATGANIPANFVAVIREN